MKQIQIILKIAFSLLLFIIMACEKEIKTQTEKETKKETEEDIQDETTQHLDTIAISNIQDYLFNIPISQDTVLIDKDYNIDFRIEMEGHDIDSVFLTIDNNYAIKEDTFIISTKSLNLSEGLHTISFMFRSIQSVSGDTAFYKSKSLLFSVVKNLSKRYVSSSVDNGKLKLTWKELDKKHTQKYIVERWLIDDKFNTKSDEKKYCQITEVENASFIDSYYVGEKAEYKITVLNNDGNQQDTWYYKKTKEKLDYYISQNSSGGYILHFNNFNYYNNCGQYYLTDGMNNNPKFIQSTNQVNETSLNIPNGKFGGEGRFWLRILPKQLPIDFLDEDWNIYGNFIYARYGDKSFEYDRIAIINNENVAITSNGNIYKININSGQKTDSIINESAQYGFLRATPAGDYIYAIDKNLSGSPVYIWATNKFTNSPDYTFQINYVVPPISDNLIAFMRTPSNTTSSYLALYNTANGNSIFTTDYKSYSSLRRISSNGEYFLTDQSELKLFSYSANTFKSIYIENNWPKYYSFFDFNPINNELCYVWDSDNIFSIRNTSDFSEINSFSLELEEIVNIDYYNKKIMGYVMDKILIYNLENGALENEIPANLSDLFLYSNNTVLIGNTIYNNNGIKYVLN